MKHSIALLLLGAALVLSACGQSSQDKAQARQDKAHSQVCDARGDIQKQVGELQGLTLATATVDGVKANLKAIRTDLGKITDAQGDLNAERKKQVTAANQAFKDQVTSTVKSVGTSLSITTAATQVKTAATQLADSYKQTLGKIDCA